jgi:D-alanyl-D-alanine carboxypeptidase/D-alanyl-D-alanine-endopeptidase (penicillin-binding protein 4)
MEALTRRGVLAGLAAAGIAARAGAEAPLSSPKPPERPLVTTAAARAIGPSAEALIEAAKLGGDVSFLLADLKSGEVIASYMPDKLMPPASTAKSITSLYALEALGPDYRFPTRLLATGPVEGGVLKGDLILAGGGDPTLSTDNLGDLAKVLSGLGLRRIAGTFGVWAGALPYIDAIDPGQPDWLGYNPAVSGLNLNFNRVNFTWERSGDGYQVGFDARAERFAPAVSIARMKVVARDLPIFTYDQRGTVESWTVADQALGKGGSRWMPVRRPDLYAGDVFRTLARAEGLDLPDPVILAGLPKARILAAHDSDPLPVVLRDMMKYSTNMTAEAVGMAASLAQGVVGHEASAAAMTRWIATRTGLQDERFVDHSGLGGASRVTASDMVAALRALGPRAGLGGLMKEVKFKGAKGIDQTLLPRRVVGKTGTLNFVSALVGYLTTGSGEERVFAIYSADVARRDAVPNAQKEDPPGLGPWLKRARKLQLQLLASWA